MPRWNYCEPGYYFITLVVEGRRHVFGEVVGYSRIPRGQDGGPRMQYTLFGQRVVNELQNGMLGTQWEGKVVVKCRQVMPDHIHVLYWVKEPLPKHLGHLINGFHAGCRRIMRELAAAESAKQTQGEQNMGWQLSNSISVAIQPPNPSACPAASSSCPPTRPAPSIQPPIPSPCPAVSSSVPPTKPAPSIQPPISSPCPAASSSVPPTRLAPSIQPPIPSPCSVASSSVPPTRPAPSIQPPIPSPCPIASSSVPPTRTAPVPKLFEDGYNDGVVIRRGQLDAYFRYIRDNMRRLLLRQEHPDLFRKVWRKELIPGQSFDLIGNMFLLDWPWRIPVRISRYATDADGIYLQPKRIKTDDEVRASIQPYLAEAEKGAVLVTPCISPAEQALVQAAYQKGLRVIMLSLNGFSPYHKPSGPHIDACARGLLLQIAPWPYNPNRQCTKPVCEMLNMLASQLCSITLSRAHVEP